VGSRTRQRAVALVGIFVALGARAAPPVPEGAERSEQGLALTFESAEGKTTDTRPARMLALYVTEGTPPTPFLAPGKFRATWTGELNLRLRERMAFLAAGRGKVSIKVKDRLVFEAEGEDLSAKAGEVVRLDKGKNPIVVTYEPPATGDAILRISWKEQRGRPEPVSPMVFTHNAASKPVAEGARLRRGRQLLADLRCTKCHAADAAGMPDLATDAPALDDVAHRLNEAWVAAWVFDPRSLRKEAHMPRVLHDRTEAAHVAAYLATVGARVFPDPKLRHPTPEDVSQGGAVFSALMCSACHTPPDTKPLAADEARVPLDYVYAKFRPAALHDYLAAPDGRYAWNPMPNFKLDGKEAYALMAYLMAKGAKAVPAPAAGGDPESGKQLVRSSGCLNCHTIAGENSELKAPALAMILGDRWTLGCMAADPAARGNAPDFGLSEDQRHALLALAASDRSSLARETPAEFSARQVAAMRCGACHARDGKESLVSTDYAADAARLAAAFPPPAPASNKEGEFFAPDQRPPILTWAGEKLRPEWAAAFMGGRVNYKPRPYLHGRMPAFTARAALLAEGLAAEHGYGPKTDAYPAPDQSLAEVGQKLVGTVGGFSCVQCHAVGASPSQQPFEAPAPNMQHIRDRLLKEYYERWMFNPIKVDPATKMPAFADAEGKTAIRDVYDGDATKQFESVWQFLLRGKDVKPPGQ
jgi:mono/diheme cytochrome c family protein